MAVSEDLLIRVQAVTGTVLAGFVSVHLAGHFLVHISLEAADAWMRVARHVYQAHPAVEAVLVGTGVVHAAVGIVRMRRRVIAIREHQERVKAAEMDKTKGDVLVDAATSSSTEDAKHDFPVERLFNSLSGLFLSATFVMHALAARYHYLDEPCDMTLPSAVIITSPLLYYPYYVFLGASGAYHLLYGGSRLLAFYRSKWAYSARGRSFRIVAGSAVIGMVSVTLALGGVYYPVLIPRIQEYIHKTSVFLGGLLNEEALVARYHAYAT